MMSDVEYRVNDNGVSFHVFLDSQRLFLLTFSLQSENMEKLCSEWLEMKLFKPTEDTATSEEHV